MVKPQPIYSLSAPTPLKDIETLLNKNMEGLIYEDNELSDDNTEMKIWKTAPIRLTEKNGEILSVIPLKIWTKVKYGTSFMATDAMKIATIPLGYAHGYSRSLSNQGRVLVQGKSCRVIGTVNMNMLTIDVSELEHVKKGDEVVVIGSQQNATVTVASFSDYSNQLNYELLTRIAKTIPRKII